MPVDERRYHAITNELKTANVTLVAVSKTKSVEEIKALYDLGQRDFGENYVQELTEKVPLLPRDIRWHFIGHLQSNKVKYIAPFIHLIHVADSLKLLQEINKQALKNGGVIDCLLQVYIAKEETKYGLNDEELAELIARPELPALKGIRIKGLMGMASFSNDMQLVAREFHHLKNLFDKQKDLSILSMGMSSDYQVAIKAGSTMVRIGSLIFGDRK